MDQSANRPDSGQTSANCRFNTRFPFASRIPIARFQTVSPVFRLAHWPKRPFAHSMLPNQPTCGRQLRLFLADGTSSGPRFIEIFNRTIQTLGIPATRRLDVVPTNADSLRKHHLTPTPQTKTPTTP